MNRIPYLFFAPHIQHVGSSPIAQSMCWTLAFTRDCFISRRMCSYQYNPLQTAPLVGHPLPPFIAHTIAQWIVSPRPTPRFTIYTIQYCETTISCKGQVGWRVFQDMRAIEIEFRFGCISMQRYGPPSSGIVLGTLFLLAAELRRHPTPAHPCPVSSVLVCLSRAGFLSFPAPFPCRVSISPSAGILGIPLPALLSNTIVWSFDPSRVISSQELKMPLQP